MQRDPGASAPVKRSLGWISTGANGSFGHTQDTAVLQTPSGPFSSLIAEGRVTLHLLAHVTDCPKLPGLGTQLWDTCFKPAFLSDVGK